MRTTSAIANLFCCNLGTSIHAWLTLIIGQERLIKPEEHNHSSKGNLSNLIIWWLERNGTLYLDTLYYDEYNNYGLGGKLDGRVKWPRALRERNPKTLLHLYQWTQHNRKCSSRQQEAVTSLLTLLFLTCIFAKLVELEIETPNNHYMEHAFFKSNADHLCHRQPVLLQPWDIYTCMVDPDVET
ncbi:hypothetical protein VNO78_03174 [Psophocarpus tetragonolobus]|uniref:Pectinesterase catalytic domain-containing protein n=1 Tax=Psophocarpus tetragonolobus TaxID=3891 RepID=A0AAN9XVQ4_PSOTE